MRYLRNLHDFFQTSSSILYICFREQIDSALLLSEWSVFADERFTQGRVRSHRTRKDLGDSHFRSACKYIMMAFKFQLACLQLFVFVSLVLCKSSRRLRAFIIRSIRSVSRAFLDMFDHRVYLLRRSFFIPFCFTDFSGHS